MDNSGKASELESYADALFDNLAQQLAAPAKAAIDAERASHEAELTHLKAEIERYRSALERIVAEDDPLGTGGGSGGGLRMASIARTTLGGQHHG